MLHICTYNTHLPDGGLVEALEAVGGPEGRERTSGRVDLALGAHLQAATVVWDVVGVSW